MHLYGMLLEVLGCCCIVLGSVGMLLDCVGGLFDVLELCWTC